MVRIEHKAYFTTPTRGDTVIADLRRSTFLRFYRSFFYSSVSSVDYIISQFRSTPSQPICGPQITPDVEAPPPRPEGAPPQKRVTIVVPPSVLPFIGISSTLDAIEIFFPLFRFCRSGFSSSTNKCGSTRSLFALRDNFGHQNLD